MEQNFQRLSCSFSASLTQIIRRFLKKVGHPDSQKIPRLLWNPIVNYRVHKNLPLLPILDQMNSVHTLYPAMWSIPFGFSDYNSVCISYLPSTCYNPAYHILILSPKWHPKEHMSPIFAFKSLNNLFVSCLENWQNRRCVPPWYIHVHHQLVRSHSQQ